MDFTTKIKNKLIAIFVATSLIFVYSCEGFAYADEVLDKQNSFEEQQTQIVDENLISEVASNTEELITDITGTNELNDDICSTTDNVLVADGYEMLLEVPKDTADPISMSDGYGEDIGFYLPDSAQDMDVSLSENGTAVYSDNNNNFSFALQALQAQGENETVMEGVRTSIIIDNVNAPHSYDFTYDLNPGEKIIRSDEFLGNEYNTGELYVVNEENTILYIIDEPWAKDANGNNIETQYSVKGDTVIQTVDFNEETAFPIVADPSAWQVAACIGALAWAIGSAAVVPAKILKIKKYIKALGGLKKSVKLMMGATSAAEKGSRAWKALKRLGCVILDIGLIYKNCKVKTLAKKLGIG